MPAPSVTSTIGYAVPLAYPSAECNQCMRRTLDCSNPVRAAVNTQTFSHHPVPDLELRTRFVTYRGDAAIVDNSILINGYLRILSPSAA